MHLNVWKQYKCDGIVQMPGIDWIQEPMYKSVDKGKMWDIPDLKYLCMRKLSFFNNAFAGNKYGRNIVHSIGNLNCRKIVGSVKKFDYPTRNLSSAASSMMSNILLRSTDRMATYMDVKKYYGTQRWTAAQAFKNFSPPLNSSSGLRAGPNRSFKKGGETVNIGVTGRKLEQLDYLTRRLDDIITRIQKGELVKIETQAGNVVPKHETFKKYMATPEQQESIKYKMRFYWIGTFMHYALASMVQGYRQKIERGKMIKVGLRWWHGGAQSYADQLRYNDPNMVFDDGDVETMDHSINAFFLSLYSQGVRVYFDFVNMTEEDTRIFNFFVNEACKYLNMKIVHLYDGVWVLVFGTLDSGVFQTSHANSWIMGLWFWMFFEYQMDKFPRLAPAMEWALRNGLIQFCVYGDDHNKAIHRLLHPILCESEFAKWLWTFFGVKLRDVTENQPFLTVPNAMGEVSQAGLKFLKRRFIKNQLRSDLPDVLPWRPTSEQIMNYAYGKGEPMSLADYLLSALGNVYDGLGTNPVTYQFFLLMFRECEVELGGRTMEQVYNEFILRSVGDKMYMTRLLRKAGIDVIELLKGFPSEKELLDRHIYDANYVNFTPVIEDDIIF